MYRAAPGRDPYPERAVRGRARDRGAPHARHRRPAVKYTPGALFSEDERAAPMFFAYCRVLAEHQPFVVAFAGLIQELAAVQSPKPQREHLDEPDEAATLLIRQFATTWSLGPELGVEYGELARYARGDASQSESLVMFMAAGDTRPPDARWVIWRPEEIERGVEIALIPAGKPTTFTYRLHKMTPAQARDHVDAMLQDLRDAALRQLEAVEEAWQSTGYKPISPHHLNDDALRQGAQVLFDRAVLKKPWSKVSGHASISAKRDQAKRWSQTLGVPLPDLKS